MGLGGKSLVLLRQAACQLIGGCPELSDERHQLEQEKAWREAWLELSFDSPTTVVALEVANGFQRRDALGDLFSMNSRPSRVAIAAGDKRFTLALDPDCRAVQRLTFPEPVTARVLRITVLERVKGTRWDQVALSEVIILGHATRAPSDPPLDDPKSQP